MAFKNTFKLLTTSILVGLLASSITSCGNTNESNSDKTSELDVLAHVTNDLTVVDGEPLFEEEVEINIWSINGDPDKAVQEKLFSKFNDIYKKECITNKFNLDKKINFKYRRMEVY